MINSNTASKRELIFVEGETEEIRDLAGRSIEKEQEGSLRLTVQRVYDRRILLTRLEKLISSGGLLIDS